MNLKVQKVFSYLLGKYPSYSDTFLNFANIYAFAKGNQHLLRNFLDVISDFRSTMEKTSHLTEDEYQLLDEVLLEFELEIAAHLSGL